MEMGTVDWLFLYSGDDIRPTIYQVKGKLYALYCETKTCSTFFALPILRVDVCHAAEELAGLGVQLPVGRNNKICLPVLSGRAFQSATIGQELKDTE